MGKKDEKGNETGIEVPLLFKNHSNCFYIKNEKNIGLYQNQLKCLKVDNYMYKMVVGSDDIILPNSIDTILSYIDKGDFALLFSNYYSFIDDYMILSAESYQINTKRHSAFHCPWNGFRDVGKP